MNKNFKGLFLSREILEIEGLNLTQRCVLAEILFLSKKNKACFANNAHFSDFFSVSVVTVSRAISALEGFGLIVVRYDGGRREMFVNDKGAYQNDKGGAYQNDKGGLIKMIRGAYQNDKGGLIKMIRGAYQNDKGAYQNDIHRIQLESNIESNIEFKGDNNHYAHEDLVVVGPQKKIFSSAHARATNVPKEKSSAKKEKVIWAESEYQGQEGLMKLEADLRQLNPDYDLVDVEHYRQVAVNWSISADRDKFDWLRLIAGFILRNKNTKDLKLKSNVQRQSNNEKLLEELNQSLAKYGY